MQTVLAARSNFSIGESILTIERLVSGAAEAGAKAVALTDTMTVTGMIDFTTRAKKASLKPIIGCRLRLVDDPFWRKVKGEKAPAEYFVTWYVLSEKGLQALFKLLTLANSDERFYMNAKLSFDDLYKSLSDVSSDDVAIASSDVYSVIQHKDARDILATLKSALTRSNVFLTMTPINSPLWDTLNKKAARLAKELDLPTLVTRPTCYAKDGADAAEIMDAVCANTRLDSLWHRSPYWRDLHAMDTKEFADAAIAAAKRVAARGEKAVGPSWTEGLKSTDTLVDMVKYEWSKAPVSLPKMATDEFAALVAEVKKGWSERFKAPVFAHQPSQDELRDIYKPRLSYELETLRKLGFSGYFLLVQDVVRFAKSSGILVGPGRGSVGGSLVAYLMGITDCDPIRFGLLFERFINPDRIDLPDADLDFMSVRRHEVVEYLVEKYGRERVAGISNYLTLASASTIRDVSKAFGLPENEYRCSKLAPKEHGQNVKLVKAAEQVGEIAAFRDKYPEIWKNCLELEGVMKSLGRHAAGIVVGGCDLVERSVIERRKDGATINWDKRIVEDQGLIKMDILGLSTLDLIHLALSYIRERHPKRVDLMRIPLDDPKVLANFAAGLTTGVFQFESGGMRRLLKELGKDGTITFEDITAATALYRPGPMESGMMDSYYRRKQGEESVEYDHPLLRDVLKETYGVFVYQEEVMQASRVIAGYSAPDADKLRKIMGKKLPEEMAKERGKFVDGCIKTVGSTEEWAGELFDKIEGFAGYGFNKSHSVEYTLISYQSMWLKTYYPVEFFAAALSLMDDDKLPGLLKDAERLGIEVSLPDVNISTDRFEIVTDTQLCIPFNRVKGLSETTARAIVEARNQTDATGAKVGDFTSIDDFTARVNRRLVNKAKVAMLDKVGAFARIEPGQLPAKHPDRIKDQRDLIPGLINETVPINRDIQLDKVSVKAIIDLVTEYREATQDDGLAVKPMIGKKARFCVIMDAADRGEEEQGQMTWGSSFGYITDALKEADLSRADGYWTALLKRTKSGKIISQDEISAYAPYLARELDIIKPPVIVLMGSTIVRQFIPDFKGKASDSAGKVIYSAALDANIVIGFSPGEIYYDPDKQASLNEVFSKVSSLLQ